MQSSKPIPATIVHAKAVFGYLADNAKIEKIPVPMVTDEAEVLVYRGRIGDAFDFAGVSKAYYSKVRKFLTETGAINMIAKGTVHATSVVVLDPDALERNVNSSLEDLTTADSDSKLSRRVTVLEARLGGINVESVLRDFELRLERLEAGESKEKIDS